VNQGPKDPRKKLNHTCVAGGTGKLAMQALQDLLLVLALEVTVALRLMEHDENGHQFTRAEDCATLAKMTRPK